MSIEQTIRQVLRLVNDPELPAVSVVDLGMVSRIEADENGRVTVHMLPTFVGCPALHVIERRVRERLRLVQGVTAVDVNFQTDEIWTSDRITDEGKTKLKGFGIAPPPCMLRERKVVEWSVACPYCESTNTRLENLFGPTACRSLYHCEDCRQPFEVMKPV